ncbi:MAG: alpha/beta hydrolase [Pseudomonadota bacterium]|nr:alpha/beta hydrolase [Pseudomonadota bacterium]
MKAYRERRYTAGDGKSLYYREYGDPLAETIPMLCLPGLSRNCRDFQELAMRHAPKRRVICPDYRGRGRSDYDQDPKNYHPKKLLDDIRHLLVAANLHHFVVIGTSMGGILAIALSVLIPSAVRGIVLNDIGPDIGGAGFERILQYLGKDNPQSDWETATAAL